MPTLSQGTYNGSITITPTSGPSLAPMLPVTATIGGIQAQVLYAGTSPGIVTGAMQVNILIPANPPSGSEVPLVIVVGTGETAVATLGGITIAIQ